MLRAPMISAALALAAGCSLDVDYGDTRFQCESTSDCPDGFSCVAEECRPSGGDGAPTAAFTSDASFLVVSFDATSSTDPDGDIADHAWSFGDDSTGTGATITHTYDAEGTYEVTLTVTDDAGNTDSISNEITVTAPPEPLARDDFERTSNDAWGSAAIGGIWTLAGVDSVFHVADGRGRIQVDPGVGPGTFLADVTTASADMTAAFSVDAMETGNGLYVAFVVRRIPNVGNYSIKPVLQADGEVRITLSKRIDDADVSFGSISPGLTYQPDTVLRVRAQVFGSDPTTLRGRIWADGDEEPGDWHITIQDDEPELQDPGVPGFSPYLSSSAAAPVEVAFDDLLVVPVE